MRDREVIEREAAQVAPTQEQSRAAELLAAQLKMQALALEVLLDIRGQNEVAIQMQRDTATAVGALMAEIGSLQRRI